MKTLRDIIVENNRGYEGRPVPLPQSPPDALVERVFMAGCSSGAGHVVVFHGRGAYLASEKHAEKIESLAHLERRRERAHTKPARRTNASEFRRAFFDLIEEGDKSTAAGLLHLRMLAGREDQIVFIACPDGSHKPFNVTLAPVPGYPELSWASYPGKSPKVGLVHPASGANIVSGKDFPEAIASIKKEYGGLCASRGRAAWIAQNMEG